jgi:hypothetical protein
MASPGVVKLLIEQIDRADGDCEFYRAYVERFHVANTNASVFEERLKTVTAVGIMFGVGVGLGCALLSLAPCVFDKQPIAAWLTGAIGGVLVIGTSIGRGMKR